MRAGVLFFVCLSFSSRILFGQNNNSENFNQGPQAIEGLKFSGLLRNDAYLTRMTKNPERSDLFSDILETRLIMERDKEDWSFYADGRFYIYAGEAQTTYGPTRTALMRAYIRYFSGIGDFTLGKTYVNFGIPGLFNPFEIDKNYQLTDLQYARQGIYAFEYLYPWQDLSGLKLYGGFNENFDYNPMWGISPGLHIGKFDTGAILNHSDIDNNITGVYFKGDAFVGIQGSWGASFNDQLNYQRSQVSAGIDYSFLDGKLITSLLFYYNESGAENYNDYKPSRDSFFLAKYYGFLSITWLIDDFWNLSASAFMNFVDLSTLLIPSLTAIIANGLSANLQFIIPTAKTRGEFAQDTVGEFSTLIRMEGKF